MWSPLAAVTAALPGKFGVRARRPVGAPGLGVDLGDPRGQLGILALALSPPDGECGGVLRAEASDRGYPSRRVMPS